MTTQEIIAHFGQIAARGKSELQAEKLIGKTDTTEILKADFVVTAYTFGLMVGARYALKHLTRVEITGDELRDLVGITIAAGER